MKLCPQLRRLSGEHGRWLAELARSGPGGEEGRAARLLRLWDAEILPRCRLEEEVLIPELARHLSEADAVVVFTLGDHVALRALARELRRARGVERGKALVALERKLAQHVGFEERTLFPVLQETLGCEELARLAAELGRAGRAAGAQSVPAGRSTK